MTMSLFVPKVHEINKIDFEKIYKSNSYSRLVATGLLSNTLTDCEQEAINESAGNSITKKKILKQKIDNIIQFSFCSCRFLLR